MRRKVEKLREAKARVGGECSTRAVVGEVKCVNLVGVRVAGRGTRNREDRRGKVEINARNHAHAAPFRSVLVGRKAEDRPNPHRSPPCIAFFFFLAKVEVPYRHTSSLIKMF